MDIYTQHIIAPESLGRIITDWMMTNKVGGEALAGQLGISRPTLIKMKQGKEVRMTLSRYREICDFFF